MGENTKGGLIGRRLGQYLIEGHLGKGGMGEVYLARDCALDRLVAVKVLAGTYSRDGELVSRFRREAQAAARLNHPHIVQVHTVDVDCDPPYMAMEYVEGLSLDRLVDQDGPLSWQRALTICGQVASALACSHAHGIIHRDIKPANILIDRSGRARVTDFGIARVAGAQTELTAPGMLMGSPHYMSPEHCGTGDVSPASDIFSLGSTVFELISGRVPFPAETTAALVKRITLDPTPSLTDHVLDVPQAVQDFVASMMAKDPSKRYATAEHVIEDLRCLQGNTALKHGTALNTTDTAPPKSLVDEFLGGTKPSVHVPRVVPERPFPWRVVAWAAALLIGLIALVAGLRAWQPTTPQWTPTPAMGEAPAPQTQPYGPASPGETSGDVQVVGAPPDPTRPPPHPPGRPGGPPPPRQRRDSDGRAHPPPHPPPRGDHPPGERARQ